MTEGIVIAILGVSGSFGVAGLTLLGSIWYRLGKLNGLVAKHEKLYQACPLCPEPKESGRE